MVVMVVFQGGGVGGESMGTSLVVVVVLEGVGVQSLVEVG